MNIVNNFSKYLTNIEYPKEKTSWNVAGTIKGQNAFYKFDVRGMIKESENRAYKTGHLNTKADKMVFEFKDQWVILDIEEINKYVKNNKLKDLELNDLISKLEWTIFLTKN
jgi:hypothetical protein